jgi:predicted NAD/FAD-binding protein
LRDVLRFNTLASGLAEQGQDARLQQPLEDFLNANQFGEVFRDWYLLPMLGCIWSCPTDQMLRFPVATLIRFCHNHGLIQVNNRPRWHTVRGGARQYVARITERIDDKRLHTPVRRIERSPQGVRVFTDAGPETFDHVILACHADQALALLAQPSLEEATTLAAIRSQPNEAVLHTDASVMPQRKLAWAAWNYERSTETAREQQQVCLHYWINQLQPLPFDQAVIVSLNPLREIDPACVLGRYAYDHPVFDLAAIEAQGHMAALQGQQHTWYAGAWLGYGFHEDGLRAGQAAARGILNAAAAGVNRVGP